MEQPIYSVTQINTYIQSMMDSDRLLSGLCIRGEISNYKVYPSGHHYFSLKDATGALRCVMFKSSAVRLRFRPENGMKVLAMGKISVFPRDGAYQLYCTSLTPDGVGDLHVAFEQLKAKLQAQGLFDPAHKKPLPRYPGTIAIITSSAGAAVHDMLRILRKRYPLTKVLLFPVRVQGVEAPAELCGAIRYVNRWDLADLIITGRGGGSLEDLWAFNDEMLARTIFESRIPVISAVGHEPDVTISDYVADLRAATPSNAAELAVPDQEELTRQLRVMAAAMSAHLAKQVKVNRQRLRVLAAAKSHGLSGRAPPAAGQHPAAALCRSAADLVQEPPRVRPSGCGAGRHESPEGPDPGLCHGPDRGRAASAKHRAGGARRPVCAASIRWPDSCHGGYHRTVGPGGGQRRFL